MFLETIRIQNGEVQYLDWHQQRVDRTYRNHFGTDAPFRLADLLPAQLPQEGVHKLRIVYSSGVDDVSVSPYKPRPVFCLMLVECDDIDYAEKTTDRDKLNACFEKRGKADDCLIVRNGLVTDTSIANVALTKGDGVWYTPAQPLLPGTTRGRLLAEGVLKETEITESDLYYKYKRICVFNAMLPFGSVEFPTKNIRSKTT